MSGALGGISLLRVSSMWLLHTIRGGGGQVSTPSAEGDGQAAVDDPDALNLCVYDIGQESIQRDDERRRLFEADELRRQPAAHHGEEKLRDRNAAEGRSAVQRNAHFFRAGDDLPDLHLEGHADEFPDRADDAQHPVFETQLEALDRIDAELLREGVELRAVDAHFEL